MSVTVMTGTWIDHHDDRPARLRDPRLGSEPCLHPHSRIRASRLGAWTEIGPGCDLQEMELGDWSYLAGDNEVIYTSIGRFCSIARGVRINPGNHPMQRVTQHHLTYRRSRYGLGADDEAFFTWRRDAGCRIGHDVWIGHNAAIMPGVNVGIGAVIGTGAIVTRDVAPYAIAVGVPARVIRHRFDPPTVEGLLASRWWDWDEDRIRADIDLLCDPSALLAREDG